MLRARTRDSDSRDDDSGFLTDWTREQRNVAAAVAPEAPQMSTDPLFGRTDKYCLVPPLPPEPFAR